MGRDRSRETERSREQSTERSRESSKPRKRSESREHREKRSKKRRSSRERREKRDRSKEKRRHRDRSRDKEKSKRKDSRERSRKRRRSKDRDRSRSKDRDRSRDKHRSRDRDRDRDRDRSRDRDRKKDRSVERNGDQYMEEKDVKMDQDLKIEQDQDAEISRLNEEAQNLAKAALLEAEEKVQQRKERIELWRREKAAKEAAENKNVAKSSVTAVSATSKKNWSLEDDDDDGEEDDSQLPPILEDEKAFPECKFLVLRIVVPPSLVKKDSKKDIKINNKPVYKKSAFGLKIKPLQKRKQVLSTTVLPEFEESSSSEEEVVKYNPLLVKREEVVSAGEDGDALEAFMEDVDHAARLAEKETKNISDKGNGPELLDYLVSSGDDEEKEIKFTSTEEQIALATAKIQAKRKDMVNVNHSFVQYEPFNKQFYIEPPELKSMTHKEVDDRRMALGGIKVRGARCPKPIEKWAQFGLPPSVLEVIRKVLRYEKPTGIQAQAIPAVMSGRDVIGIAKTGSGKTIAFLLPMLRHIKDQRPVEMMEGPIALIMTPTRELAVQIHRECRHFIKLLNIRASCVYGGTPIKEQIAELKKGAEIIICTPGRMIDLLTANAGRVTNLKRVTYVVLDEADRMFDMGFEPQVIKIVNNIRPDKQVVLFSATFPKKMEALARKILRKPLEIIVGGRSVVCQDVTQYVEVRDEDSKFIRLLEILGQTFIEDSEAKVLIFVDRQESADSLLAQLLKRGYPCSTLHGGKDQADRDSTISDFKNGDANILIATSVAARGLDVKQLKVVINYECPNHMEDYIHRVGRTGRAGSKGEAYTFITPDQDKYAGDIIEALHRSNVDIPEELDALEKTFLEKVRTGEAAPSSSGYGGKGLEKLDKERDIKKRIEKKTHGGDLDEEEEDEDAAREAREKLEKSFDEKVTTGTSGPAEAPTVSAPVIISRPGRTAMNLTGLAKAREIIASFTKAPTASTAFTSEFAYEIEINDYPQKARWIVTSKETISRISEMTGAAITTRGSYYSPGTFVPAGKRKLYLYIEGDSQISIDKAKTEVRKIITEATLEAMETDTVSSRYTPSKQHFLATFPRPPFEQIPGYMSYYPMVEEQQSPNSDTYSDRIKHRKELHKEVEKRRRKTINDGIEELSKLLPESTPKSKGSIISSAVNYIKSLKSIIGDSDQIRDVEEWNYEKVKFQEEIKNLNIQIKALKTENASLKALQRFDMPPVISTESSGFKESVSDE